LSPWVSDDRLIAVEERRFVVLLGILTLFIGYRTYLPSTFPFPLPYPTPHLQVLVLPLFDRFVYVFGFYAVFMFCYFSEDKLSDWLRIHLRRLGWATMIGFWVYFFYISSGLLGSIFFHDTLLVLYLLAFEVGLLAIGARILEYVLGTPGLIRWVVHRVISFYFSPLVSVSQRWVATVLTTRLGERVRRIIPNPLKRFLARVFAFL
jgi:hypothetical protein